MPSFLLFLIWIFDFFFFLSVHKTPNPNKYQTGTRDSREEQMKSQTQL